VNRQILTFDDYIESLDKYDLQQAPIGDGAAFRTDINDVFSEAHAYPGIYVNYEFQRKMVRRLGGKVLNAACADDPAHLGDIGATNLDIQTLEGHTGHDFSKCKNFVHGSVLKMPFPDESYDVVVLGEFIEHCKMEKAVEALLECRRVVKSGGHIVLTFPLDARSVDEQRGTNVWPQEYDPGITCAHQTWWTRPMQAELRRRTKLIEIGRAYLLYVLTVPLGGFGLVWTRP
jgi:SAM-dependent methyltransferase